MTMLVVDMLGIIVLSGCSHSDERLVRLSQDQLKRQADQNRQVARQSELVAQTARQVVEADAAARQQFASERLGLTAQHTDLQRRHDDLERQRQQIAGQRHRDPILAAALVQAAALLACSRPLVFCFCLLHALRKADPGDELLELLTLEVLADHSRLSLPLKGTPAAWRHPPLPLPPGAPPAT